MIGFVIVIGVLGLLVVGGLIVLVTRLATATERQRVRHVDALTGYAAARGLRYAPDDRSLPQRFAGPPFGRGSAAATHVLQGVHAGRPVVAFEYSFTTHAGDRTHHHRYGVVAVALPVPVPELRLVRASAIGSFVDAFLGDERQIGDPVFDAAFRVFTSSPPFAADVLTPGLRAWLLAQRAPATYLRDNDLVVVDAGQLTPVELDRRLAYAAAFLEQVPGAVWERAAAGPPTG